MPLRAVAAEVFDEAFQAEGKEGEEGQEGGAGEGGAELVFIVEDLDVEGEGVGFSSDVA